MINHSNSNACEVCWVHSIRSLCLIDSSTLSRNESENSDFVFLKLHDCNDNTMVKQLTKIVQHNLPSDIHDNIKKKFTSKSWRKGGITFMSAHPALNKKFSYSRLGYKCDKNRFDTYLDNCVIGLSLPVAIVLNEYENFHQVPIPFSFDTLRHGVINVFPGISVIGNMILKLCPSNLDEFQPNGRLFNVLEIYAATFIGSYNKMKR